MVIPKKPFVISLLILGIISLILYLNNIPGTCPVTGETGHDAPQGWGVLVEYSTLAISLAFFTVAGLVWFLKR